MASLKDLEKDITDQQHMIGLISFSQQAQKLRNFEHPFLDQL